MIVTSIGRSSSLSTTRRYIGLAARRGVVALRTAPVWELGRHKADASSGWVAQVAEQPRSHALDLATFHYRWPRRSPAGITRSRVPPRRQESRASCLTASSDSLASSGGCLLPVGAVIGHLDGEGVGSRGISGVDEWISFVSRFLYAALVFADFWRCPGWLSDSPGRSSPVGFREGRSGTRSRRPRVGFPGARGARRRSPRR